MHPSPQSDANPSSLVFASGASIPKADPLIRHASVRTRVLITVAEHRPALAAKMTRVSRRLLLSLEAQLLAKLQFDVKRVAADQLDALPEATPNRWFEDWLINRARVKAVVRSLAGDRRIVVRNRYLYSCDSFIRERICMLVAAHPSRGKTVAHAPG